MNIQEQPTSHNNITLRKWKHTKHATDYTTQKQPPTKDNQNYPELKKKQMSHNSNNTQSSKNNDT